MKRFFHVFASTLVVLVAGASARADFIPWTYSWNRDPISISADLPGTGSASLTQEATPKQAAGNSDIVATNMRLVSVATADHPDRFVEHGHYILTLHLTDNTSGASGILTFSGKLGGFFSATSSNVTNVFNLPTTQSLLLGGITYTVTIGPYSPPGPPSAQNSGSIAAHVDVSGSIRGSPEPSSMLLSCLGLTFLGGAAGRKRLLSLIRK